MNAAVVFDLDDTLIDTRGVLLPEALARTAAALGVPVDRLDPRGKTVEEVAGALGPLDPAQLRAAAAAWYSPEVPSLEALPGVAEVLAALRGRVRLFLVTRGDPARQRAKLDRSGLHDAFDEVIVVPIRGRTSKRDVLRELLRRHGIPPGRCAVVGDDPADELAHGLALGCITLRVPEVPLARIPVVLRRHGLL